MKTIGFIIPNYPHEKRVALLPKDINGFRFSKIYVEKGFGKNLNISDSEYERAGCIVLSRDEVFKQSDIIFSLKLIQPSDYPRLKNNQIVLGWTHPFGSGSSFYNTICKEKNLILIDIDSTCPRICYGDTLIIIDEIPIGFCSENSYVAGYASCLHALTCFGTIFDSNKKVAILSSGNVAQGSFNLFAKLGFNPKLFYRRTMNKFFEEAGSFDIIVNGIEVESGHIISKSDVNILKPGCLLIDAAADAAGAIEFTTFTSYEQPIIKYEDVYYYCINNSPSILYKDVSPILSKLFSEHILSLDYDLLLNKYLK